jgi:hypothetical protein
MKILLATFLLLGTFIAAVTLASPVTFKAHKALVGKDAAKVNCAYCHVKVSIPKEKGNEVEQLKKGEFCAMKACHPSVDKK